MTRHLRAPEDRWLEQGIPAEVCKALGDNRFNLRETIRQATERRIEIPSHGYHFRGDVLVQVGDGRQVATIGDFPILRRARLLYARMAERIYPSLNRG